MVRALGASLHDLPTVCDSSFKAVLNQAEAPSCKLNLVHFVLDSACGHKGAPLGRVQPFQVIQSKRLTWKLYINSYIKVQSHLFLCPFSMMEPNDIYYVYL